MCLVVGVVPAAGSVPVDRAQESPCPPGTESTTSTVPGSSSPPDSDGVDSTAPPSTNGTLPDPNPARGREAWVPSGAGGSGTYSVGIAFTPVVVAQQEPTTTTTPPTTTVPPTTVPPTTVPPTTTPPTTVPPPTTTVPSTTTTVPSTTTTAPGSDTTQPPTTVPPETTTTVGEPTTTVGETTTTVTQPEPCATSVMYDLLYPVVGESPNISPFGAPRDGGRRSHMGNDLMAPKMAPIVAAADGFVERISFGGELSGTSLRIRHDDGWSTHYVHLNNDFYGTDNGLGKGIRPGLRVGDRVQRGEVIGWVGDSGNAEGTVPHLHFELRNPAGTAVDPEPSLDAARHVRVDFEGPSPAFIDLVDDPNWRIVTLLASAGLAVPCDHRGLRFCPDQTALGRDLQRAVQVWQGPIFVGALIPYRVPLDTSRLATGEEGAPAAPTTPDRPEVAPTPLQLPAQQGEPDPDQAGSSRQGTTSPAVAAPSAPAGTVVDDTGCGEWRFCPQSAVTLGEVSAALSAVLGLDEVPGRRALSAPVLESIRSATFSGVLGVCTDLPAALLDDELTKGDLAGIMTRAADLQESEVCDSAALAELWLMGGPFRPPLSAAPFAD